MINIYRNVNGAKETFLKAYDRTLQVWDVPLEARYIDTSFGKTHILVSGPEHAEPLLLFHGYAFSSTMWIENIKELSETYRVYAVDFIGDVNKSEPTRLIETKTDCVKWFRDIVEQLQLKRAHVGGLSYGGFIALVLASHVPEFIDKLVVMSPGAAFQPQSKMFFIKCLMAGVFPSIKRLHKLMDYMSGAGNKVNETLKDQFVAAMQNALPRNKLFASYLKDEELRNIHSPVLLLIGDQEVQYEPEKAIARARQVVRNIEAHIIPNAGHGLPMERPEQVNSLMLSFLRAKNVTVKQVI